jgi:hypothetical protein
MTQAAETAPGTQFAIETASFSLIELQNLGLYLQPNEADTSSQLIVQAAASDPLAAGQLWGFLKMSPASSLFRIFNAHSGLCIDAHGNDVDPSAGTSVDQFAWQPGQQNQVWLYSYLWLMSGYTTNLVCTAGGMQAGEKVTLEQPPFNQFIPNAYSWSIPSLTTVPLYYIVRLDTGLCLTANPDNDSGEQLKLTPYRGTGLPTQMWGFIADAQGNYRIINAYNGFCADAAGNDDKPSPGTDIIQFDWQPGQRNQVWTATTQPTPIAPIVTFASVYDATKIWSGASTPGAAVQLAQAQSPPPYSQLWLLKPVS